MADIAILGQRAQLGVESVEGTEVDATKRLPNMTFTLNPEMNFQTFMATGSKFVTSVVPGSRWTEGSYEGPLSFGEIVYPLASLAHYAAPSTALGSTTWTFTPQLNTVNTTKSYTLEIGDANQAKQVLGMFFNSLTMNFSPDEANISGDIMGGPLSLIANITAAPTDVENVVAHATRSELYYAATFAGLGTATTNTGTLVTRAFSAEVNLANRYNTFKAMNASNNSYTGRLEVVPESTVTLRLGADRSGGDFVEPITLADAHAGATNYLRIRTTTTENTGTSTNPYTFIIDMACKVTGYFDFDTENDVLENVVWDLSIVEDSTAGKAMTIYVINEVAGL